jgi:hypothetical protein
MLELCFILGRPLSAKKPSQRLERCPEKFLARKNGTVKPNTSDEKLVEQGFEKKGG